MVGGVLAHTLYYLIYQSSNLFRCCDFHIDSLSACSGSYGPYSERVSNQISLGDSCIGIACFACVHTLFCRLDHSYLDCPIRGSDWARRVDTDRQKWTRFDTGGNLRGILGTSQNLMVPTKLVHIVVVLGRGTWDRQAKKNKTSKRTTSQQVLVRISFVTNA